MASPITMGPDGLVVPERPHSSLYRGGRDWSRYLARRTARVRRCGRQGLRRRANGELDGGAGRPESLRRHRRVASGRDGRRVSYLSRWHQRSFDHPRRWRYPEPQRGFAPNPRPVRLSASGSLVHRSAISGQTTRADRHGDLSREHRGCLCGQGNRSRHGRRQEAAFVPS